MTFSLVGMCRRTGMFGAAVTTSNMNVGTRCPYAKAGVGAVLTQNRTDNRLGPQGIELLTDGKSAPDVIEALTADNPTIGWRRYRPRRRDRILPRRQNHLDPRRRRRRWMLRHRQHHSQRQSPQQND